MKNEVKVENCWELEELDTAELEVLSDAMLAWCGIIACTGEKEN